MHQAAIIGETLKDAREYGWEVPEGVNHNWGTMVNAIQEHIGGLNWGYRVALREKKVTYLNEYAIFEDSHTLKTKNKKGVQKTVTAKDFILATGGRPRYVEEVDEIRYAVSYVSLFQGIPKYLERENLA